MVLFVVDVQKGITDERLYKFDKFIANIKKLIHLCRANNIKVVFVQHDDGSGSGFFAGDRESEIHEEFRPDDKEKIFVKKVNSIFHEEVGLIQYLKDLNAREIMIVGLETDYCIDVLVKCGFEHGFNIFISEYTNSFFDNVFMIKEQTYRYYNEMIWKKGYSSHLR